VILQGAITATNGDIGEAPEGFNTIRSTGHIDPLTMIAGVATGGNIYTDVIAGFGDNDATVLTNSSGDIRNQTLLRFGDEAVMELYRQLFLQLLGE